MADTCRASGEMEDVRRLDRPGQQRDGRGGVSCEPARGQSTKGEKRDPPRLPPVTMMVFPCMHQRDRLQSDTASLAVHAACGLCSLTLKSTDWAEKRDEGQ